MHKFFLPATLLLAFSIAPAAFAQESTAHCSLPGELVSSDATGDAALILPPDPIPDHDVLDVSIAELTNDSGEQKIYFTLTTAAGTVPAAVPLSSYQVKFFLKDGVERFVLFNPYPFPAELNPVTGVLIPNSDLMFAFGSNSVDPTTGNSTFSIDGPADAESSADGGTITLVLSEKQLRQLQPGEIITEISGISQFNGAVVTFDLDTSDVPGIYQIKGNDTCVAKRATLKQGGSILVGAFAPGFLLMLAGVVAFRRRQ